MLSLAPWFGSYLGRVYLNRPAFGDSVLGPVELFFYRLLGTSPRRSMTPREYATAFVVVIAGLMGWIFVLLLFQGSLPGSLGGHPGLSGDLAFHIASAFSTNTDFYHFTPETQVTQGGMLLGLQVALFLSAASGLSVTAAFVRGFVRRDGTLGNFYVDMVRSMTRILLPLSLLAAVVLVLLGLPETLTTAVIAHPLGGGSQVIPLGPVASWTSIELLGTNGGGWYAANAASPLANPSALSSLFQTGLMLLIPLSFPFAFAQIVRKPGEGLPYLGTIVIVLVVALALFILAQGQGNGYLQPIAGLTGTGQPYPVGQETRFTLPEATAFQVVSVYSNVGASNMQLGSLTPVGQLVLLFGMFTQSTPGGDGTGFGMLLVYALIAVFVGGLMVGRTPEYLGKKIGEAQVKWAALILLIHPILIFAPLAAALLSGQVPIAAGGPSWVNAHTFTVVLYEFTSESANNGSGMSFAAYQDATPFFNIVGAVVMLAGRFFPMLAMLAIGGLFSRQEVLPPGPGTLRTRSGTFTVYLTLFTIIITGLLFLPVMALGPLSQIVGAP